MQNEFQLERVELADSYSLLIFAPLPPKPPNF